MMSMVAPIFLRQTIYLPKGGSCAAVLHINAPKDTLQVMEYVF